MYSTLGGKPVIPEADALNLQSAANKGGDTRVPYSSIGKRPGMLVWISSGGTNNILAFATGGKSSDKWQLADGNGDYVPTNISGFTPAAGCTYSSGLLTADGTDDPTASQVVALKAGKYYISGTAACEGPSAADIDAPKLVVEGATDGVLLTKTFTEARHATAAESASPKQSWGYSFTLTVDQNVTIEISNVNESGALEAGSSYITFNPLEAI